MRTTYISNRNGTKIFVRVLERFVLDNKRIKLYNKDESKATGFALVLIVLIHWFMDI